MAIDIGQPWALAPRRGKHYGTKVVDRDGNEVMTIWSTGQDGRGFKGGEGPSEREQAFFNQYTPERWKIYCSDCHYECQRDLDRALEVIRLVNEPADA